jgi:predicted DNA-binding transcriptional regulator AlpA
MDREFLREKELADWLNVKPRTLKFWRKVGRGPRSTPLDTGAIRYRRRDVERWLESCSKQSEGTAA